jgi:hypothetical protein
MVTWDIQRDGRAWGDEAMSRYQMTPEKTEMVGGRLYGTEEERLTMLALLLENVGADRAVRLGNASTWRGAAAALNEEHDDQETEAPVLPEAERHALETALLANVHAQHEVLKALLDGSWSVFTGTGVPFPELVRSCRNNQVRRTTIGAILKAGGSLRPSSGPPHHHDLYGLTPQQFDAILGLPEPNPVQKPDRWKPS